jgi:hypothetical protein
MNRAGAESGTDALVCARWRGQAVSGLRKKAEAILKMRVIIMVAGEIAQVD